MQEYLIFEDRIGKLCSRFDLKVIKVVYAHWDLTQNPDNLIDLVSKEIQLLTKQNQSFQRYNLRDDETKRFLVYQTSDVLFHLKRLKKFLDDGISKGYKLTIE